MSAHAELVREHRLILSVIFSLEQRIADAAQKQTVPVQFLHDLVRFSREFVDRCHHGKEEGCLFPCLERRGMPREGGLLGIMLDEHETGRALVARIAGALERYERGEAPARAVLDPCRAYADLLRQHIAKEDDLLFPIGDGLMSADDQTSAAACFTAREAELGTGARTGLEALAGRLAQLDAEPGRP